MSSVLKGLVVGAYWMIKGCLLSILIHMVLRLCQSIALCLEDSLEDDGDDVVRGVVSGLGKTTGKRRPKVHVHVYICL